MAVIERIRVGGCVWSQCGHVPALPVCKPGSGAAASLSFLGGPEMLPQSRMLGAFPEVVRGAVPGRAVLLIPSLPAPARAAATACCIALTCTHLVTLQPWRLANAPGERLCPGARPPLSTTTHRPGAPGGTAPGCCGMVRQRRARCLQD